MIFTYEGLNQNGKRLNGGTNSEAPEEIVERLRRNGWGWAEVRDESGTVVAEF